MQRRLDPETGVNKPFKNVFMSGAHSEIFSGRGHQYIFRHLFKRIFFSTDFILSNLRTDTTFGVRGHAPP